MQKSAPPSKSVTKAFHCLTYTEPQSQTDVACILITAGIYDVPCATIYA